MNAMVVMLFLITTVTPAGDPAYILVGTKDATLEQCMTQAEEENFNGDELGIACAPAKDAVPVNPEPTPL